MAEKPRDAATLERVIRQLLERQLSHEALRHKLEALTREPNLPGLTWVWGPALMRAILSSAELREGGSSPRILGRDPAQASTDWALREKVRNGAVVTSDFYDTLRDAGRERTFRSIALDQPA